MVKNKTSKKRKFSYKAVNTIIINGKTYEEYDPLETLLNEDNILAAIAESVESKDLKGITEIVNIYNEARRDARKTAKAKLQEAETALSGSGPDFNGEGSSLIGYSFSARSKS